MNDENSQTNLYSDNENFNPNPDFKNLLKISNSDILNKDKNLNADISNFKKSKYNRKFSFINLKYFFAFKT